MVDSLIIHFYRNNYGISHTQFNELSQKLHDEIGQHHHGTIACLEPDEFQQTLNNYKHGLPTKKYTCEETIANLNAHLDKQYCNQFHNYKKIVIML